MRGQRLARFTAIWSDGSQLVLHAHTVADARDLARRLTPAGVQLQNVEPIRESTRRGTARIPALHFVRVEDPSVHSRYGPERAICGRWIPRRQVAITREDVTCPRCEQLIGELDRIAI